MIQVGQTVGNYKITAKLGEGGMGVVYLAEHPVIGRKVAIKAIHPELSKNPEVISRFMTEAKSVNQIGNEHIVDISDFGNTPDGEFFFVMEFLQGEALADRLKHEHAFAAPRALKIAAQVADALFASHEHGIIHRDLKPENIYLITRGTNTDFVKVLDFGLAKLTQGEEKVSHKTRTGSVMGTPYYMSPEQCEGKASVDHRADVYSLGVIVFEMLTGKVPFGGEGYGEIIVKHITAAPPSVRAINPILTEAHEAIVLKALAKNRDLRFQSMAEFRNALLDPDAFMASEPGSTTGQHRPTTIMEGAPVAKADTAVSGQVVFGAGGNPNLGAVAGKAPTTFRHGAGEMVDEDFAPPKSKKGVILGALGAAVLAGVAAMFLMKGKDVPPPVVPAVAPPAVPVTPPPVPVDPKAVRIEFDSTPKGATVVRSDTKEELGKTPFAVELPYSKESVELVFKLDGHEDKVKSLVPQMAAHVDAVLLAIKKPDEDKRPSGRPRSGSARPPKGPRPAGGHAPMDDDAVLEPSFK